MVHFCNISPQLRSAGCAEAYGDYLQTPIFSAPTILSFAALLQ